ncbi:hypothetical protein HPB52_010023 [Rhipicephalus sanguineus]|uniref:Uncharacterized protein n=1 Tax=Rhipicephalus sanguineus TaxID=34632 RepID=A0A9D4PL66_RHISA|nr:hypothetical protein HPB52_010023 [Rhipicephalus sanguineus]
MGGNARFSVNVDGAPMWANGVNVLWSITGGDAVIGETADIVLDRVKRAGAVVCIRKGDELFNVTVDDAVLFGVETGSTLFGAEEMDDCSPGVAVASS